MFDTVCVFQFVAQYQKNTVKHPSTRLFKNPFLEACTHVHPVVPVLVWTPLLMLCLSCSFYYHDSVWKVLGEFLLGVLIWSLTEYGLHRFIFHLQSRNVVLKGMAFLIHGIHHHEPMDKTRLVMPPVPALAIGALIVAPFLLVGVPWSLLYSYVAGFIFGYLWYDYTHYFLHHGRFKSSVYRALRKHHMHHHFKDSTSNFGVSSYLWDLVFRTHAQSEKMLKGEIAAN